MTDKEIIIGIQNKNNKILSELYRKNLPSVKKFVVENSGQKEDADDVLQEGIILIYQKLRDTSLQVNISVQAYLISTCRNIWLMRLRRKKKMIVNSEQVETLEGSEENLISDLIEAEKDNLYRKHFLKLGEGCKTLLNLIYDGRSMQEVAEALDTTIGYARKKKFICKERLMNSIKNDELYHELKSYKSVISS